jgi:3D (Asp-Asp-Asp) domain-containing protein
MKILESIAEVALLIFIGTTILLVWVLCFSMNLAYDRTASLEKRVEQLESRKGNELDVNGDGVVDENDLDMVKNYLLGYIEYTPSMDVDRDGRVDALDLLLIKQELVRTAPTTSETTQQTTIIEDEQIPVTTSTALVPSETIELIGIFKITAYCPCFRCCGKQPDNPAYKVTARQTIATEGRTIAVDPHVIPYGTKVLIDGVGYRTAEDTGNFTGNRIDLYFEDHETALRWTDPNGHHDLKVYIVKP